MTPTRLGQHWLTDSSFCARIADALDLTPDLTTIEIGGGKGALTRHLATRSRRLIVYEIDSNWADHLRTFGPSWVALPATFEVRQADALTIDWTRDSLGLAPDEPFVVTGNIPYYITSSLLLNIAYSKIDLKRAVFLIQKEVADKIASMPGDSDYGRLTVSIAAFLETRILFDIPPEAFKPAPKVVSAVIKMIPRDEPLVPPGQEGKFERLIQAAFHMRRKTLKNNLKAAFPGLSDPRLNEILGCLGIKLNARPQDVAVGDFVALTGMIDGV